MKRMTCFNRMEELAWETCDPSVLIDDAEEHGSDKQFYAYVQQIVQYYVQEMFTEDILSNGFDEELIDLIGNIDVLIPKEVCDFYKGKTDFENAMNKHGGNDNVRPE